MSRRRMAGQNTWHQYIDNREFGTKWPSVSAGGNVHERVH